VAPQGLFGLELETVSKYSMCKKSGVHQVFTAMHFHA